MEPQASEHEQIVRLPYQLLPWQLAVKEDRHRNRAIHAGRRSGKTHLLCDLLIEAALTYAQGRPCWYVAPTYGMAKDIAWSLLKDFTADLLRAGLVTRYYETELRVDFRNGSSIHLKGADNQDSLRGRGLGFLGIDEIALMHRDVWLRVLRPATSDYLAPVVFIGTPKGYNYFFDLCEQEKRDPAQWKTFHVKTSEAGHRPERDRPGPPRHGRAVVPPGIRGLFRDVRRPDIPLGDGTDPGERIQAGRDLLRRRLRLLGQSLGRCPGHPQG